MDTQPAPAGKVSAEQEGAALPGRIPISTVPFCAETPDAALRHPVTPSGAHYVRSNFAMPSLPADHAIGIGGDVRRPYRLSMEALRSMPRASVTNTMECAGNDRASMQPLPAGEPWRTGAVSTARWSGVPLGEILRRAAPLGSATAVVVEGADHGPRPDVAGEVRFARSLPIDAIGPDALVADAMDGAPIPSEHGGPVRLIVPGWYGMASVKWITRITVTSRDFDGYFQTRRYVYDYGSDVVPVTRARVKSFIVEPAGGARVPCGERVVWGWAWSGDGPIASVELTADPTVGWISATLEPGSPHAWTRWQCALALDRPGQYVLRSRATDAAGNTQPEVARWNRLGYGNNAVRMIIVEVVA